MFSRTFFHYTLFVRQCVLYLMFTVIRVVMLSAPGKLSQNNYFTRYMVMKQWLSWDKLISNMADIDLRAISMNCNGLNDAIKGNAVFSKLKKSGEGIFLLQETHSTAATEHKWRNEWGSSAMYFSHGESNANLKREQQNVFKTFTEILETLTTDRYIFWGRL